MHSTRRSMATARTSSSGPMSASPHHRVLHSMRRVVQPRIVQIQACLNRPSPPARTPPAVHYKRRKLATLAPALHPGATLPTFYKSTHLSILVAPISFPGASIASPRPKSDSDQRGLFIRVRKATRADTWISQDTAM